MAEVSLKSLFSKFLLTTSLICNRISIFKFLYFTVPNLTKELRELQPSMYCMYIREFAPPKNPYNARKAQIQRQDIPTKYKALPEYEIGLALYIKQLSTVEAEITNYKQAEEKQNKIILQEATKILEIRKQLQQNADNIAKVSTPIPAQAKISLVR